MRRTLGPILLIILGLALVGLYILLSGGSNGATEEDEQVTRTAEAQATRLALSEVTPQPIFPTPTTGQSGDAAASMTLAARPTATATPDPRLCPLPDCWARVGVSGRLEDIAAASGAGLPFGNFFDWWLSGEPPAMSGQASSVEPRYWQMVSVSQAGPNVSWVQIGEVIDARPGSIWIVAGSG